MNCFFLLFSYLALVAYGSRAVADPVVGGDDAFVALDQSVLDAVVHTDNSEMRSCFFSERAFDAEFETWCVPLPVEHL